jgi:beta-glucosidase-like glycosyl hydrolase
VGDVYTPEPAGHGYASPLDAVAMSLKAGTDMDCGDWGKHAYLSQLPAAVKAGKASEADLDKALLRLTTLQMELGLFDPKADSHFFTLGVDLIHSDEHTRHALEASQVSVFHHSPAHFITSSLTARETCDFTFQHHFNTCSLHDLFEHLLVAIDRVAQKRTSSPIEKGRKDCCSRST